MRESLSFKRQIEQLEEQLDHEKRQLQSLEDELEVFERRMEQCREGLARLKQVSRGEVPDDGTPASEASVPRVETNPDSGRPPRGARRNQIEAICRRIGQDRDTFRTRDVLDQLAEVEREVSEGLKSYAYSVMTDLEQDGVVEKIGWGQWKLAG